MIIGSSTRHRASGHMVGLRECRGGGDAVCLEEVERNMYAPFITVTSATVREGMLDEYRELNGRITEAVADREPRIIAFHVFLSEDERSIAGIQFHPDPESFEFHLEAVKDLIASASGILEVYEYKVLGPSSDIADRVIDSLADSGVRVERFPNHVGGFTRSSPDE